MSIEALLFNGFSEKPHISEPMIASTILRIRTTGCMRTQQSPYEIVGDCSDEGGHQYQAMDRFFLREDKSSICDDSVTCSNVRCFL